MNENSHVISDTSEQIMTIKINRPEKKNALTQEMYVELKNLFDQAENSKKVSAIIITGTTDTFTAGNDMSDFIKRPPESTQSPVFKFLEALSQLKKPLIAAANGAAIGIGTTLLLHCDVVFLGENAKLQMPFVNLGTCPEAGASYLLPKLAGYLRASELLLTGKAFTANQALAMGLANHIEYEGNTYHSARECAISIANQPSVSVQLTKALLKQSDAMLVSETLLHEAELFIKQLKTAESREAISAFIEKRRPNFKQFNLG